MMLGLDGSPVPPMIWAIDGAAPLPAEGFRGGEHLPVWVLLLIVLMAAAAVGMVSAAAQYFRERDQQDFKESAGRLARKMLDQVDELDHEREVLIDQAGRKPWQRT